MWNASIHNGNPPNLKSSVPVVSAQNDTVAKSKPALYPSDSDSKAGVLSFLLLAERPGRCDHGPLFL